MSHCRHLRFKSWYAQDWVGEEGLAEVLSRDDTQYWCLQTLQPWGPDDQPAAPETCGEHRACCAARRTS